MTFTETQNHKLQRKNKRKKIFLYALFESRERVFDAFNSKIFPIKIEGTGFSNKVTDYSNLKILTPKQMLQLLPKALAQLKVSNTSESLLN